MPSGPYGRRPPQTVPLFEPADPTGLPDLAIVDCRELSAGEGADGPNESTNDAEQRGVQDQLRAERTVRAARFDSSDAGCPDHVKSASALANAWHAIVTAIFKW